MEKTIKINLGGTLFQIDEEAYKMLRQYLQEIDARLRTMKGGAETIEDIESRIAEIFQSEKGTAGVLTRENVENVISIIGKPEEFDAGEPTEPRHDQFRPSPARKLYRNPEDSIIGGVCGGLGAYFNIESVWVRVLFVLFACFFFLGVLVYIALWIALPNAVSDQQKREMYGSGNINAPRRRSTSSSLTRRDLSYSASEKGPSAAGNAVNEIFRAIGKVLFVILRIFLIMFGIIFVVSAFMTLIALILVLFFRYPGFYSTDTLGINLFYFQDFLHYVVNPAAAPWILALTFIVILMPLLAMIYWGVKMIFWFKARDGVVSLVAFLFWIASITVLSFMLFNEGISYSESGRTEINEVIEKTPSKLYILSGNTSDDLATEKEISFPDENYRIWFSDKNNGLQISTLLDIYDSDDNTVRLSIKKRSMGRNRATAKSRAEALEYTYSISADTIRLDEYFSIPSGHKWSFDEVHVQIYVPEGTEIHFDNTTSNLYHRRNGDYHYERFDDLRIPLLDWEMTSDGLVPASEANSTNQ